MANSSESNNLLAWLKWLLGIAGCLVLFLAIWGIYGKTFPLKETATGDGLLGAVASFLTAVAGIVAAVLLYRQHHAEQQAAKKRTEIDEFRAKTSARNERYSEALRRLSSAELSERRTAISELEIKAAEVNKDEFDGQDIRPFLRVTVERLANILVCDENEEMRSTAAQAIENLVRLLSVQPHSAEALNSENLRTIQEIVEKADREVRRNWHTAWADLSLFAPAEDKPRLLAGKFPQLSFAFGTSTFENEDSPVARAAWRSVFTERKDFSIVDKKDHQLLLWLAVGAMRCTTTNELTSLQELRKAGQSSEFVARRVESFFVLGTHLGEDGMKEFEPTLARFRLRCKQLRDVESACRAVKSKSETLLNE